MQICHQLAKVEPERTDCQRDLAASHEKIGEHCAAMGEVARAGGWTKPTSRSTASGNTCTGRWTASGHTVDFLLPAHRDRAAARFFFERAIDLHGVPEKITIDKSGANTAAMVSLRTDSGVGIQVYQSKYLNNFIEQDQRAIKRVVRPVPGFKSFRFAALAPSWRVSRQCT